MGFSLSNFVKRAANDINPFDGPKQAPRPATTAPVQQPPHQNPLQHAFGNIGHAVGNVEHAGGNVAHAATNVGHAATTLGTGAVQFVPQFAENYANTFANLGRKAAGAPNATIQQNMGGNRLLNNTLKFSGATGKNKQLAGDVAQVGLSALPGVGKGANLAVKAATGAGVGAGFNAASTFGQGGNLKQIGQSAALGGTIGAALPIAGRAVKVAAPKVGKLAKDVATMKPQRNVSDQQLAAANRVSMSRNGFPDSTKPGDVQAYRQVQQKLGVDANNHKAVDDLIGARMTHQNRTPLQNMVSPLKQLAPLDQSGHIQVRGGKEPLPEPSRSSSSEPTISQPKTAPAPTTKLVPQEAPAAQPTTSLVAKPATAGESVALPNSTTTATKFTSTLKNSPEVSKEVAGKVNANYVADTMEAAHERATAHIKQNGVNKSLNQTLSELDAPRGTASRDTIARALEHAKRLDAKGTPAAQSQAAHLYDLAGEHGSASGQSVQILAAIARRSPAGLRNKAFKDLKKAGVNLTPELQKEIQGHINGIAKMKDGPAKDMAIAVLQKAVSKHIPQGKLDNAISVWKAGLLSGVKTQGGNFVSNATFGGLKKVADLPATLADKAFSVKTGLRTKAMTGKGTVSGFGSGLKTGAQTMKTGIDPRNIGDKYEQHAEINFSNKWIQRAVGNPANTVFRGMQAADQPFYYSAMKNSLYDQAKADGITKGLRGEALQKHMTELATNPTEKLATVATNEANKSVLNYDTIASKAISGMHKAIDNFSGATDGGKQLAHAALNVLAPFTRVPSAFLSRTVDFTPLGLPKELFHQIAAKKFDQRALSQAIGESATGTGIIGVGMALNQSGLLSGNYPKNDPKEVQRWKAEGITPNSVKIGNKWVSLNYLGPVGLLFNSGKQLDDAKGESALNKAGSSLAGLGQGLLGQSFLQGFTGFNDALQNPERSAKSFVNSQVGSIIPNISNDVATATDKFQRQADTVGQSIKNRIPGLREQNPVKQDVYGNQLQRQSNPLDVLNPLKPSKSLTDNSPAIKEVNRLHGVDPNNSDLQVTPTPITSLNVEGKVVKLNNSQKLAVQKQVGTAIQDKWNELVQTPEYKALSDTDKAKALSNLRSDTTSLATRQYVVDNNLGTYAKSPSKKVAALGDGDAKVVDYATATTSTGSTPSSDLYKSPDAEYKSLQTKYDKQAKAGFNSPAQKITLDKELARAKVGSKYDKSVRDAYNLSNADLYDYVSNDPNGKDIAEKVLAYSQDLKDAGITATAKFKTKYGVVTLGKSSTNSGGSGGRKSGTSNSKFAASLKANNSAASSNQNALLALVKNAKVHGPSGSSSRLKVAGVTLKKQVVKPTNRKKVQVA